MAMALRFGRVLDHDSVGASAIRNQRLLLRDTVVFGIWGAVFSAATFGTFPNTETQVDDSFLTVHPQTRLRITNAFKCGYAVETTPQEFDAAGAYLGYTDWSVWLHSWSLLWHIHDGFNSTVCVDYGRNSGWDGVYCDLDANRPGSFTFRQCGAFRS